MKFQPGKSRASDAPCESEARLSPALAPKGREKERDSEKTIIDIIKAGQAVDRDDINISASITLDQHKPPESEEQDKR